jgi:LSD1 subclass zinc finger protein
MIEFRCSNCNKLLGKIEGKAEIKCPKCKTMNYKPHNPGMSEKAWRELHNFVAKLDK